MKQIIIFLVSYCAFLATADRVIMTSNGYLEGVTVLTGEIEVEAFLGVPFAEPPNNHRRFGKPVPNGPWKGVFQAKHQPPPCMQNLRQRYYEPSPENMTEDCLFLNLWVPYSRRTTHLKPIILFSHGGAFNMGSGNMPLYDGVNMSRFGDVIVANMNYRVGVMGFYFGCTEDADGNMGVYDQILAAEWVKKNARSFGGDPNHIVLFGESAGAMVAGASLLSPLTKNLFKRVIMHSGAPTFPLILDNNERLLISSQKLADMVGCANKTITLKENASLVVECLKRLPAKVLTDTEGVMAKLNPITFFPRTGDAAMPKPIVHLLKEGKFLDTEMLLGINEFEGTFLLSEGVPDYFGNHGKGRAQSISRSLIYQMIRVVFLHLDKANSKKIASHYIDSIANGTTDQYVIALANSLGDYLINCDSYFHAEYHSVRNPVYFYVFTHRPSTTWNAEWMGATHIDELQYVYGNSMIGDFNSEEVALSERMMARWIAFAKTGNPNVPESLPWPAFTHENPVYLDINIEDSVRLRPDKNRCEFWRNTFQAKFDEEIIARIKESVNRGIHATTNTMLVIASVSLAFVCRMVSNL